ncbi:uncharacterized protein LOC105699194 [Orussus abietinus]|uniref:uncharacterized protein LOC105699194 n=1 Tax=Orussus abietinus TaxID=222816 RepID=UPI000625A6A3|nr:uncharacterized protein LOC105699194 [Orussus abietinus]
MTRKIMIFVLTLFLVKGDAERDDDLWIIPGEGFDPELNDILRPPMRLELKYSSPGEIAFPKIEGKSPRLAASGLFNKDSNSMSTTLRESTTMAAEVPEEITEESMSLMEMTEPSLLVNQIADVFVSSEMLERFMEELESVERMAANGLIQQNPTFTEIDPTLTTETVYSFPEVTENLGNSLLTELVPDNGDFSTSPERSSETSDTGQMSSTSFEKLIEVTEFLDASSTMGFVTEELSGTTGLVRPEITTELHILEKPIYMSGLRETTFPPGEMLDDIISSSTKQNLLSFIIRDNSAASTSISTTTESIVHLSPSTISGNALEEHCHVEAKLDIAAIIGGSALIVAIFVICILICREKKQRNPASVIP